MRYPAPPPLHNGIPRAFIRTATARNRPFLRFAPALFAALLLAACRPAPVRLADGEYRRGIALGLYASSPYYDYTPLLAEIADHHANAVSLFVALMQDDAASTAVERVADRTAPDKVLRLAIRAAHRRGLEVMVVPIVLLRRAGDDWRGTLRPRDVNDWFASYTEQLVAYARIAEEEGAAWLCVGSEFCSLEDDAPRWRAVVAAARGVFRGRLIYSANWDHLDSIAWWGELDAMGMSGYFELADSTAPTLDQLLAAWRRWRARIRAARDRAGARDLPLVFTEIGYPSQDGAARAPWDYTLGKPIDLEEQRLCFEAFFAAWRDDPNLLGAYVYTWFGRGGPDDGDYTPRGKPAAELLRMTYAAWQETARVPLARRGE